MRRVTRDQQLQFEYAAVQINEEAITVLREVRPIGVDNCLTKVPWVTTFAAALLSCHALIDQVQRRNHIGL